MSAQEAVAECLRICDMFADENIRMADDTIMMDPLLSRVRDNRRGLAVAPMTDGEWALCEKLQIDGCVHSAMYHAAKNIGDAIRERFSLPKQREST